jgi:catechol 2,3-dioxygenase-like lactoylglutathione lyase family enzyme
MFDHVTLRVGDRTASERFYDTVLGTLEIAKTYSGDELAEWNDFSIAQADDDHPVTRGVHLGFVAPTPDHVDEFWRAGTAAGHRDDGEPGPRPQYTSDYYGGFLLDPDGNSAEGMHYERMRRAGNVDHVWLRVADVGASKRFYSVVAGYAGFTLGVDSDQRVSFRGADKGSLSLVAGARSEHLHIAFPAPDHQTVEAFHAAAVAAGYSDRGGPGERPEYHAGYYGAYVLDPDGHNIELVDHGR